METLPNIELVCAGELAGSALERALDEQTYDNLEVVAVSASPDRGIYQAFNNGLDHAQGDYLAFAFTHDWMDPSFYADLAATAATTGADIVSGTSIAARTNDAGEIVLAKADSRLNEVSEQLGLATPLADLTHIPLQASIYKRSVVQECGARFGSESSGADVTFIFQLRLAATTYAAAADSTARIYRFVAQEDMPDAVAVLEDEISATEAQVKTLIEADVGGSVGYRFMGKRFLRLLKLQEAARQADESAVHAQAQLKRIQELALTLPNQRLLAQQGKAILSLTRLGINAAGASRLAEANKRGIFGAGRGTKRG